MAAYALDLGTLVLIAVTRELRAHQIRARRPPTQLGAGGQVGCSARRRRTPISDAVRDADRAEAAARQK